MNENILKMYENMLFDHAHRSFAVFAYQNIVMISPADCWWRHLCQDILFFSHYPGLVTTGEARNVVWERNLLSQLLIGQLRIMVSDLEVLIFIPVSLQTPKTRSSES